jgi:hypothetical protein
MSHSCAGAARSCLTFLPGWLHHGWAWRVQRHRRVRVVGVPVSPPLQSPDEGNMARGNIVFVVEFNHQVHRAQREATWLE